MAGETTTLGGGGTAPAPPPSGGRKRTAKALGTRHDMNYFKGWSVFRRWRFGLSVGLCVLGVLWLSVQGVRGKETPYSSGPLSKAHAFFGSQCSLCHVSVIDGHKTVGYKNNVTDDACLSCHEAPAHQRKAAFTPTCASCHLEHKGALQLAHIADNKCVQCHADLPQNTNGHTSYAADIRGFNRNHPEFTALRSPDPGTVAFNHSVHMRADGIRSPKGQVHLICQDCHRPIGESGSPWKYAGPHPEEVSTAAADAQMAKGSQSNATSERQYAKSGFELMAPITYAKNCQGCHALPFDKRFSESAPHKNTEVVHQFVVQKFNEYLAKNPNAWREPEYIAMQRVPGILPPAPPRSASEWMELRIGAAEKLLWGSKCRTCHQISYPSESATAEHEKVGAPNLPSIKPANIKPSWLNNAIFSHASHSAVACASCHNKVLGSQNTSDVLIPSITVCQSCHNGKPIEAGGTESRCFECHQYHDWKNRTGLPPNNPYTIPELTGKERLPVMKN